MAYANHALLSLYLLLAVAGALTATTVTEAASHRRLQQMPQINNDDVTGPLPLPRINGPAGPLVPLPPTAVACWKSILSSESCVDDILESLAKLEVRVSKKCCSVLEKIGDKCIANAFSSFPFNPLFPPLVKHFCNA